MPIILVMLAQGFGMCNKEILNKKYALGRKIVSL
jgi:hypothetical protein